MQDFDKEYMYEDKGKDANKFNRLVIIFILSLSIEIIFICSALKIMNISYSIWLPLLLIFLLNFIITIILCLLIKFVN